MKATQTFLCFLPLLLLGKGSVALTTEPNLQEVIGCIHRLHTQSLHLRFPTDLADFGEGLAENSNAGPLEAFRRRGKEVFCESGYS